MRTDPGAGRFVVAAADVYCTPACPRTGSPGARVFPTAAAAQHAGLLACCECGPEAPPGPAEWDARDDLTGRAMRLIADGVVEREGVPGLARRLGYSERHVTRVLTAELGAGPLSLARANRAQLARLLIETTPLPLADIAFASGFASIRQFNDTIRGVFGTTPTRLRRGGRPVPTTAGTVTLRLEVREPFDFTGILAFLSARAIPGVESVGRDHYARTLRLDHGTGTARLTPARDHVLCALRLTDLRDLNSAINRLRRLMDLDADPVAVDGVLSADPALAASVERTPGVRVPGSVDGTETVVRALLGQQVTVAAARTAARRLTEAVGTPLHAPDGGLTTLFPTASAIAERGHTVLSGPSRRIQTVRAVCAAIADGDLSLHVGEDGAALRTRLQSFAGIGPWTAGYTAMRLLGDPDVLLLQDVALRNGAEALDLPATADGLAAYAGRWRPFRSYAGMHLWQAAAR